jgi:hypothetical protein
VCGHAKLPAWVDYGLIPFLNNLIGSISGLPVLW